MAIKGATDSFQLDLRTASWEGRMFGNVIQGPDLQSQQGAYCYGLRVELPPKPLVLTTDDCCFQPTADRSGLSVKGDELWRLITGQLVENKGFS